MFFFNQQIWGCACKESLDPLLRMRVMLVEVLIGMDHYYQTKLNKIRIHSNQGLPFQWYGSTCLFYYHHMVDFPKSNRGVNSQSRASNQTWLVLLGGSVIVHDHSESTTNVSSLSFETADILVAALIVLEPTEPSREHGNMIASWFQRIPVWYFFN